jgi:tetratricopeptide (TPR) repeat protein
MPALRAVWQNRSRFSKAKTLRSAWREPTSCWQSWPKVEAITKAQRQSLDAALAQLNEIQLKVVFGALLGDAYVRAGFVDQAEQIAAVITPLVDTNNSEQLGYLHLLQGDIALLRGQPGKAIELLNQSDKESITALSMEAVAHAYQQSGDIDQAVASYEKMFSAAERSLGWEPQQRWLVARYTLASDYSSRGDKQKARDTLAALLNLWKNPDPNLVILNQAKTAYAGL